MNKIAIAYDFCGVLDVKDSHKINDSSLSFRIGKMADLEKCFRLFKLIEKFDLHFFSTSTYQKYTDVTTSLLGQLSREDDLEVAAFGKSFRRGKGRTNRIRCDSDWNIKNQLIYRAVVNSGIDTVITLEDDEPIDAEYNPIHICGSKRMTEENFAELEANIIKTILGLDVFGVESKWNSTADSNHQWETLSNDAKEHLYDAEISSIKGQILVIIDEDRDSLRKVTALNEYLKHVELSKKMGSISDEK